MTKNIFQNIAIAGLSLILATSNFSTPTVNAQDIDITGLDFVSTQDIGVYPCESEFVEGISQSRSWIIKNTEAGKTIETCVLVANPTDETKTIKVGAQSAIPTSDGAISMTSDGEKLTGLGSWIDLNGFPETVEVSSGNGRELKFKIKVPANTKPGEYAGAISVMEVSKEQSSGNFNILRRYGARIYTSVKPESDFNLGTEFDTFEFILPGSKMYEGYTKQAKAYKWDDITMTWQFKTTGNIFAKQTGELTITKPDGKAEKKEFSTDYFPTSEVSIDYVTTDAKFDQTGKYKARFDFKHVPSIPWNKGEDIKNISSKRFVETEFEVTQEMLDQLKADKNTLDSLLNEEEKKEVAAEAAGFEAFKEEEKLPQTGGSEEKNDNIILMVGGITAGVVIFALIGIVAFILLKKNKKEESK
jgi:hypothetical protein